MSTQKTPDEAQASAANGGESDDVTPHADPGTPITVGGDGGSVAAPGTPITVGGDGGPQEPQQ